MAKLRINSHNRLFNRAFCLALAVSAVLLGAAGAAANQWQPNLVRNTTQIYPFEGKPG